MTPPVIYTEATLADYMIAELRGVGTALGWTATDMAEPVNSAILAYGVSAIADCTNIRKVRALALVEAWKAVVREVSGDYDFSDGAASYKRSQLQAQAMKALEDAERAALLYSSQVINQQPVKHVDDPYKRVAYETASDF